MFVMLFKWNDEMCINANDSQLTKTRHETNTQLKKAFCLINFVMDTPNKQTNNQKPLWYSFKTNIKIKQTK